MSPSAIATPAEQSKPAVTHSSPSLRALSASGIRKTLIPDSQQKTVAAADDPIRYTQKATTAHMVTVRWTSEAGWETPDMVPYGKISLEPTASVLHYATETFEGLKAYRGVDNKLRLFRPQLNCARMLTSNARVALPSFDPKGLLDVIAAFLATECKRWLPEPGTNLYVRPSMIGSGEALGISVPAEALFFLFAALFPQASKAPSPGIKLLASTPDLIRAWPGGFGNAKVGASYGPAMAAHGRAKGSGCSQTLWLFGDDKYVTEAGASNFFVIWRRKDSGKLELVTSSLSTGVVLPGITRQSVLEISRERLGKETAAQFSDLEPLGVVEKAFTMDEIVEAHGEGRLVECFVTGTAMFITPVSLIRYGNIDVSFPMTVTSAGTKIALAMYSSKIKAWLEDIIYGRTEHEWGYVIDEA
ncbi:aminotransferase [Thelonectria olida]|uniref:Branched-chain-amino-acid aminotransferase n=1 Tax=Thelonectria olida TaxID=1576542 RepID=A0A9P8W6R6_9HYPO|nr:aminotransferase [Thelonectria olida]